LNSELVDALRDKKPLPSLKPEEKAAIAYGQEYYRTGHVSKGTFQVAVEQFGVAGLSELTMLMGFCAMLAFNLDAFDIDISDKRTEPMMPV
jgi:4-carboxymuconolactone decarboxylase